MSTENHAETISKLTLQTVIATPVITTLDDGRIFAFTPKGADVFERTDITEAARPPRIPTYVSQQLTVQTAGSMIAYINRFKNDDTAIFADIAANRFVGAIDYHKVPVDGTAGAQLLAHKATLQLQFSEQWATWTKANEKEMNHLTFSKFIEENMDDISDPIGAQAR